MEEDHRYQEESTDTPHGYEDKANANGEFGESDFVTQTVTPVTVTQTVTPVTTTPAPPPYYSPQTQARLYPPRPPYQPRNPPPLMPPILAAPKPSSDIWYMLQYMERKEDVRKHEEERRRRADEERRRADEERRREDEERRRADEERRRADEERRQKAEDVRLEALTQILSRLHPPSSPNPPDTIASPDATSSHPPPQKAITQNPPPLRADATFQVFRKWRRRWEDYAAMVDLANLPRDKQLIQMRMCLTLDTQGKLEHTIGIPHDTNKTVNEVLDELQEHIKNSRNEALRRRDLLTCKQKQGETFNDFHVRLRHIAEEVDICHGNPQKCEETQLKMIILMGVRDEELVQKLLSLDTNQSLQDFVNTCRTYEAARSTTSAIRTPQTQVNAVSTYKKQKQQQRKQPSTPAPVCQRCSRRHDEGQCPAQNSTCGNCSRTGHWVRTPACPAVTALCRSCNRVGHYDKCCKLSKGPASNDTSTRANGTRPKDKSATSAKTSTTIRRVSSPCTPPTLTTVSLAFNGTTSELDMLPDTGADVTIIGQRHLRMLRIPTSHLCPPSPTTMITADGSPMAPSVGTFQATLTIANRSCPATIQVHKDVQTPLLSRGHLQQLAIIPHKFPKPILKAQHINRCKELPFTPATTPIQAKDYFLQEFHDVLVSKEDLKSTPLQPMKGPPMRIHIKDDAVPFAIHTPRQIPFAFRERVKSELDSLVAQGIIKPAGDKPSEWCHPLVVVAKPNGDVRLTVDLTKLNKQVSRPTHPTPTPFEAIRSVTPTAQYFSTADALSGYWQMELAEQDQHLTTFITPYGRFLHCRGPMGFAATGDAFCLRGDQALQGLEQCVKVVDDVLLYDEDLITHLQRINDMLTRCRNHGITLNKDKFVVAAPNVNFCGYMLSGEGIEADPGKVSAIKDFPTPANITDLRSFMGLVNQLAEFTPDIASAAQPLRPLMSPKRSFTWTPDHDEAFRRVKAALLRPPVLAPFDPSLPVVLQTDASRLNGLGYALLQDHGDNRLRLVQCGSRFLSDTESRYATIELEMLAVVWAMSKCKFYLIGLQHFTLMTDHRPLIPILNSYTLDAVENPRLQRLKEKVAQYLFTAVWRAGKMLCIPDALSRAPVSHPTPEDDTVCDAATTHLRSIVYANATATEDDSPPQDADRILQELRDAAKVDPLYIRLRDCVTSGFPTNRYDLHNTLLPFWKLRDHLSADGDLVLFGARVVVPAALRRRTLARLHDSHRGVEATKRRARQAVFWPGINADIANTVQACEQCQVLQPSQQQEPLMNDDHPTRPFESVSADFFSVAGKSFLVITDRLSGWPAVVPCKGDTTASHTIRIFCMYFREVGVPLRIRTDGGPQFTSSEFRNFMERWGVHHFVTSPHYPQSNGHAEAAVKAVKHLILKTAPTGNIDCEAFDRGLLELRNTPNFTGRSPAQILYGHPLRSCVPAHPQSFAAEWQAKTEDCDRRAAAHTELVQTQYNQHARPLPRLSVGTTVRIQDPTSHRWDKVGVVMGHGRSRDYEVRLPSGRVYWRNRRYLRPVHSPSVDPLPHDPDPPVLCTDPENESFTAPVTPRRSKRLAEKESARQRLASLEGEGGVDT